MSITFEKVSHIYGYHSPVSYQALDNITTTIRKGKITAIIGHTGSGKSTLVQHLNGLLIPTSGKVTIDEFEITNEQKKGLKSLRQKCGYVFQFPENQLFEETIAKDIAFGPKNFGISDEEISKRVSQALKQVGLNDDYSELSPFDLSGGQKRRVAIAGILVMKPEILILDEPTAGLDPQGTIEMMNLFQSLNQQGTTIVLVTHDMNHVLAYCDDAIVMDHGHIVKHGTVDEIFSQPQVLKDMNIELPMVTKIIDDLNQRNFHLPYSIRTIDALVEAIKEELS